eukprot:SAG31_NODE_3337_length_4388_cov_3.372814_4_plen_123_part_00
MESLLSEHATTLARLFTRQEKAASAAESPADSSVIHDEVAALAGDLDKKVAAQIGTKVAELRAVIDASKGDWEGQIGQLGAQIDAKADSVWLDRLEAKIREQLAKEKTGVILCVPALSCNAV